jgi:hypothetical protein
MAEDLCRQSLEYFHGHPMPYSAKRGRYAFCP